MRVRFVGHATALLELGGIRVLTDPFLGSRLGPLERHGRIPDPDELQTDVVVISHGHADHFHLRSLEALQGRPVIVVPRGLGARLRQLRGPARDIVEMEAGGSTSIGGLTIRAVPARHWISPGAPRAQPIGFVLDAGPRIYFAGDTGRYPGMRDLAAGMDLALLPVWTWGPHLGPGHLGPRSAAEVVRDIGAAAVVPIHWGTLYPRHLHRVWRGPLREPGDRFAAHVGRLTPDVGVRVLRPGESATFEGGRPR
ncbi:MAG TPA: MBL fold metallo-hydrolase [Candidatus Limnocylindrales bacterium]|nr:MBL fold metallo-hydrolase [Candidatus Limnocylindrales bacterium]